MNSAAQVDVLFSQWKAQGLSKEELVVKTAKAELGWPYGWGAVASVCTPDKRLYYSKRSGCPEQDAINLVKRCPVLSNKQSKCNGCEFYPDGETGLNDCQGFIKQLLQRVGISLSGGGCTSMWNNDINWTEKGKIAQLPKDKVCLVFQWSTKKLNMQHVGLYIGGEAIIECATTVKYSNISNTAWTHYAVVRGLGGNTPMPAHATIRRGSTGADVVECQQDLLKLSYDIGSYGADGKFGAKTEAAVKQFQSTHTDPNTGDKLKVDGVVGPASWAALDAAVGHSAAPTEDKYTVTIKHLTAAQMNALKEQYPGATVKKE